MSDSALFPLDFGTADVPPAGGTPTLPQGTDYDEVLSRLDDQDNRLAAIVLSLENLTQGVSATYQGVAQINGILGAVQQMAQGMGGVKGAMLKKFLGNGVPE